MLGRTPPDIQVVEPVRHGVIAELEVAEALLAHLLRRYGPRPLRRMEVVLGVPSTITSVERRAVREAVELAGARKVHLVHQPMAAAIGAGVDVGDSRGQLIVDVGGGKTEVAVVALDGLVCVRSAPTGGGTLDEAICLHLRRSHDLLIGRQAARSVKHAIGSAVSGGEPRKVEVRGRHVLTGLPAAVEVDADELREGALADGLEAIVQCVRRVLERTPAELSADLADAEVILTGGGVRLRGFDRLIAQKTGLATVVCEEPEDAVVRGCARLLRDRAMLDRVAI